jgi:hypothetical protein
MSIPPTPDRSPRPSRVVDPVFIWPVPEKADYLFWIEVDMNLPAYASFTYGTAHPNATLYPNHKLVYVSPQDANNTSKWFYASNRTNEVNYNWTIVNNNTVQRTYLVLRSAYPGTPPTVGTADTKFADYVFAGESVSRTDTELDSLYVLVTRIYSIETLVSYQWDDALERNIKITRTLIPAGTETGSQADGVLVEIRAGDTFYDVELTSEVVWLVGDLLAGSPNFPIELTSVVTDANYPFPPRLDSLDVYGAWAFAGNNESADSYSEDFFFEVNITEPMPGPYDAKLRRFLTDDPDAVRLLHPTAKITRKAETIGIIRSWSSASGTKGNRTFAQARQHNIPSTVHDEVALPTGVNYAQGANGTGDTATGYGAASLPATPGYATYAATTTTVAGVTTRRAKFGLYEVQVVEIQKGGSNVYS